MATQTTIGPLVFPDYGFVSTSAISFGSLAMSAAGEMTALVTQAPKTGAIRNIHFRTGAAATATDTDCRIETVGATTGDPSGTLWAANTNVTVLAAAITANTWIRSGNLTANASVTQGQFLAIVLAPTGTPNYNLSTIAQYDYQFAYLDRFTAAAWAKVNNAGVFALEYSDGSFYPLGGTVPVLTLSNVNFTSASSPDERGMIFQLPFPCRIRGVRIPITSGDDWTLKLYDSDGSTVLTSLAVDADYDTGGTLTHAQYIFPTSVQLSANLNYRATLLPGTTGINVQEFTVSSATYMDALPGGQNFQLTTRTDAGAWTQTATQRPFMSFLLDGFDDAASGASAFTQFVGGSVVR